jgi:hypothetical protein
MVWEVWVVSVVLEVLQEPQEQPELQVQPELQQEQEQLLVKHQENNMLHNSSKSRIWDSLMKKQSYKFLFKPMVM